MAEAGSLCIHFGDCEIDVAAFELRRGGQRCSVEPQVFELILYLARNPDRLITKSDLIENVWGGRIVSDATLSSRIKSARQAIGDDGQQQRLIRTVHKRGVRFVGEVRLESVTSPQPLTGETEATAEYARPTLAVLPFTNIGSHPEQDYFTDGLTNDIVSDLARKSVVDVVPRARTLAHKGMTVDVQQAAKGLDACYVLDGSVRRVGDHVRIAAQLVNGRTGLHIWAQRYDRRWQDVFALRQEVSQAIVAALSLRILQRETVSQRQLPKSAEAYQYYLMGRSFFLKGIWAKQALEVARQLFTKAIVADSNYARAYAGIANCDSYRLLMDVPSVLAEDILANSNRAIELEPALAEAHAARGLTLDTAGRYAEASAAFESAVGLGPDLYEAHFFYARHCRTQGQHLKAAQLFERAAELNSNDFRALGLLVDEYRALNRHDEAMAAARRCLERLELEFATQPDNACALAFGAIIQAEVGNTEQAEKWASHAISIEPQDVVTSYNLACTFAALNKQDFALDWLKRAFPETPASRRAFVQWLEHDTALWPLHGNPEYRALLRQFKQEAPVPSRDAGNSNLPAIAVLPFANMSGDPDQEYFADGLTEDIITDLSRVSAMSVVARNSVMPYKGKPVDIPKVASDLNVDYLLEGSVRRVGNRVRITGQLINGLTGTHIWAERYDRSWDDIFELQDEMSQSIVAALKLKLLPQELAAVTTHATGNPEAYQYYMMARARLLRGSRDQRTLRVVRQLFDKAIATDPHYARAYAGIATCDSHRICLGEPGVSFQDVLANSERALALEPQLAEALAAKGLALCIAGLDDEADAILKQAVHNGPSLFEAHYFAGRHRQAQGRHELAASLFEKAAELQPEDFLALGIAVATYRSLGDDEKMRSAGRRCLERLDAEIALHEDNANALSFGASVQANIGDSAKAVAWAERAVAIGATNPIISYNLACAYCALGQPDVALSHLQRVFTGPAAAQMCHFEWMRHDSSVTPLHDNPEYQSLVRRLMRLDSNGEKSSIVEAVGG